MKALLIPPFKIELEGKRTKLYNSILCQYYIVQSTQKAANSYIHFEYFVFNGVFISMFFITSELSIWHFWECKDTCFIFQVIKFLQSDFFLFCNASLAITNGSKSKTNTFSQSWSKKLYFPKSTSLGMMSMSSLALASFCRRKSRLSVHSRNSSGQWA